MKCPKCGTEFDSKCCPECGYKAIKEGKKVQKKNSKLTIIVIAAVVVFVSSLSLIFYLSFHQKPDVQSNIIVITQTLVKRHLKSPSSAKFPWSEEEYTIRALNNNYQVASYVDSDNAFGASMRTKFIATFEYYPEEGKYKEIDVVFLE